MCFLSKKKKKRSLTLLYDCRYAVKYNEQLLLTLEEDEFSCKQRLAYKLEQVQIGSKTDSPSAGYPTQLGCPADIRKMRFGSITRNVVTDRNNYAPR